MARQFRFRVREGEQIHSFGDEGAATHGAGYEFLLSEEEAAAHFRDARSRRACELVEVVDEDAPTAPPEGPIARV